MTNIRFIKKNIEKKYCDLPIGEFFIYGNHLFIKASDYSAIDISNDNVNYKIDQFDADEEVIIPKNINIDIDM